MEELLIPPTIAVIFTIIWWFIYGRKEHQTIPVLYEPPQGLSVLECGILIDDAVNTKELGLELYNLNLQGILIEKETNIYTLNPDLTEQDIEDLTFGQKILLNAVLGKGGSFFLHKDAYKNAYKGEYENPANPVPQAAIDLLHNDYLNRLSKKITALKVTLYETLTEEGYFVLSPFEQRKPFILIGSIIFAGPLIWNIFSTINQDGGHIPWNLTIGLALAGIIFAYSSFLYVQKTNKGLKKEAEFLGFKEFIMTAEKDRIRHVLENDIDAYKKIIPYAALFDSLDKWLEPLQEFKDAMSRPELRDITEILTALDVDISLSERNKFFRAIFDLFGYGIITINKVLGKKIGFSSNSDLLDPW